MFGTNDINIKIGATDATGAAFKSAEAKMKSMVGSAKSMMTALGAGISVGAITGMAKSAIDFGSSLNDAAVATQTNVEALQVYRYAATQAGASTGQMDKALIKLNDSAYAASIGSQAEADALAKLGISAQDFARLAPEKRMEALAKSIVNAKDQNLAMSAAMDLMGSKNAPFLMQMLQQLGKDGFGALKKEAESAGQVMSAETIKQLDDAGDAIDRLKTSVTIKTGDTIAFWSQYFEVVKNGSGNVKNLRGDVEALVTVMKTVGDFFDGLTYIPRKLLGAGAALMKESTGFKWESGGNQADYTPEQLKLIDDAGKRLEQAAASKKVDGDRLVMASDGGYQKYLESKGLLASNSADGSGFAQDAGGVWRKTPPNSGREQLANEMQRTAENNARLAEKLKEANDRTDVALNQIKTGRK